MRKSVLLLIGMLLIFTLCDRGVHWLGGTCSLDRYCCEECEEWRTVLRWAVMLPVSAAYLAFTFCFKELFFDVQAMPKVINLSETTWGVP